MISSRWLTMALLVLATATPPAWGRGELRIGGPDGNDWQALAQQEGGRYVVLNADGSVRRTLPLEGVALDPAADAEIKDTGLIVMIDFAGNTLKPVRIDPEDNLVQSIEARQGLITTSVSTGYTKEAGKGMLPAIDGDPETAVLKTVDTSPRLHGVNVAWVKNMVLNLGDELPVNRIRFYPRPGFEENFLAWYELGGVSGDGPIVDQPGQKRPGLRWFHDISRVLNSANDPAIEVIRRETENLDVIEDVVFATRDLKWITLRPLDPERTWEVAELEVHGEGYVTRTAYRSDILDLGRPVTWSKIRWHGERPERTRVVIRTRTGKRRPESGPGAIPSPFVYTKVDRTGRFSEVGRQDYLNSFGAGSFGDVRKHVDVENWSFWSPEYDWKAGLRDPGWESQAWSDGTRLLSPSPTRYLQIEIELYSDRDVAPRIDRLELLLSETSAATQVVGEVWPIETQDYTPHVFTYVIRPVLGPDDAGFDRLEIVTHSRAEAVTSVLVDGQEVMDRFQPEIQDDRIIVAFDRMQGREDSEKRIEVVFESRVLRFGADFTGLVWSSEEPSIKQQVDPGNATFRFSGDVLSVRTPMGGRLIIDARLSTPTITPNGDGLNDELRIEYDVRDIASQRPHRLRIYDLSGRLVRELESTASSSGVFEQTWDGRDGVGGAVPPGIYLYRIEIEVDEGDDAATGLVSVAL